jgi:hypothetical protein
MVGELPAEAQPHPAAQLDVDRRGHEQPEQQVFGGEEFLDHRADPANRCAPAPAQDPRLARVVAASREC